MPAQPGVRALVYFLHLILFRMIAARSILPRGGAFSNPGPDSSSLVWQQGTTQDVTWSTDYPNVHLTLWSVGFVDDQGDSLVFELSSSDPSVPTTSPFSFFVGLNLDTSLNPYFFRLSDDTGAVLFDSQSFNVVAGPNSSVDPNPSAVDSALPSASITPQATFTSNAVVAAPASDSVAPLASDCSQCSIYFEYVEVYYWPTGAENTDCLSAVSDQPAPTIPANLNPQSPSAYVVFPAISAGNACSVAGNGSQTSVTMSFAPGELSTIEGNAGATREFNFADLPCPPASVVSADSYFYNPSINPGQIYQPRLAPPPGIFDLDPEWQNCVPAINQGFDPPIALPSALGPTNPDDQTNRPIFPRRDLEQRDGAARATPAHRIMDLPLETSTPSSKL